MAILQQLSDSVWQESGMLFVGHRHIVLKVSAMVIVGGKPLARLD
jgi:hypothetical protein